MSNVEAFAVTLMELERLGRVETIDAARVEALRLMAAALDADPGKAALWQQYREALAEIVRSDDAVDSDLAEAVAALRGATPVGYPQEG
jgi:hypothetical protein